MTNTTYYNLNIVEGTDIVNPLTVDNPNYEKIDDVMHDNAVSGVTLATEIANATVHAITRENSECAVIRFIATSVWKAGDTVTVDGVPVTASLPSGETLPDGAYVINANVLCILTGTNLTIYAERKKADSADRISYGNTDVKTALDGLTANKFGAKVELNPYNIDSNRYIFPSDGYVCLYCYTEGGGTFVASGATGGTDFYLGGRGYSANNPCYLTVPVRKGMKGYCSEFSGGMTAMFIPLV